jgi:SPP1 family predicted phage head-tail adaptor
MARVFHVDLERRLSVDDFESETEEEWGKCGEADIEIKPLDGRELTNAQQLHEKVTFKIRTRYQELITSKLRINKQGTIFHIGAVINEGNLNQWLTLLCSGGADDRSSD